jgi:hypothetical protein
MTVTKLPTSSTPDRREQRKKKARERAKAKRGREAQEPMARIYRMLFGIEYWTWSGRNDNMSLCPKCKNMSETKNRDVKGDFCTVCGAKKPRDRGLV